MNTISTSPLAMNLATPANLHALSKPASSGAATSGTAAADGSLGSTFLSLLSQELQNQDPTAPVDSTAMVGQMISLNQLDQLINIAQSVQSLGSGTGSPASPTGGSPASARASAQQPVSAIAAGSATQPAAPAAASHQLPFDPNTMLPVDMQNPRGTSNTLFPPTASASTIQ